MATKGRDAIAQESKLEADVVQIEIRMPGMDGLAEGRQLSNL